MQTFAIYAALVLAFGLFVALVYAVFAPPPDLTHDRERDIQICQRLRAYGWSEDDIKLFMHCNYGYYDEGTSTSETGKVSRRQR